jgi:eukaryotic-like serine/threonine-protein kinase
VVKQTFDLDPLQWQTLRRLLDEALTLAPAQRADWIARLGTEHEPLKPRLLDLLKHAGAATGELPLDAMPRVETAQLLAENTGGSNDDAARVGTEVGPYRLIRRLGAGGMGTVWLAERSDMLQRRQVALKLPRIVTGRAELAERLAREREILAALNHPNIARLYDAGISADGQPYLALEYVEGERIDAHCVRKALDVPARLRLFLQVARAVAHAHANLVVHRDLKPGNILVTEAGEVKLLDFGIAKLLEQGQASETELTERSGRLLTPDYAAPEQILGRTIGTSADVYALGVVLYELLTGSRPYKLKRESRAALEEAILQAEPARASASVADARLRKRLRGDLDTIVLKALKKSPHERYGTVEALAEDIERHLAQRPVQAQPDSRWYVLRKFVGRNRVVVGASLSVLMALVVGSGVALWQAQSARAEQQRAQAVKDFIVRLFRDVNPYLGSGTKPTVEELLVKARPLVDSEFADRPDIRAELLVMIGTSLEVLGEEPSALVVLKDAAAVAERELGSRHRLTLNARAMLLGMRRKSDRSGAIARELDELIADMRQAADVEPEFFVNALSQRASSAIDLGQPELAVQYADEALQMSMKWIGEASEETMVIATQLAFAHQRARHWNEALVAAQQVRHLVFDVRKLPSTHPAAVDARIMYGMALGDAGRLREALAEIELGIHDAGQVRKEMDPTLGSYRTHLARYQLRAGATRDALDNLRAALAAHRIGLPGTRFPPATEASLGGALLQAHRPREALAHLVDAWRYFEGSNDVAAPRTRAKLAIAQAQNSRIDDARRVLAPATSQGASWEAALAAGLVQRLAGDAAKALPLHRQALAALGASPAEIADRARVLNELGLDAIALERPDEASGFFGEAAALLTRSQLQYSPERADADVGLGRSRLARGQVAEALSSVEQADRFWLEFDPEGRWSGEAAFWLARCHEMLSHGAQAQASYARAARLLARSNYPGDAELALQASRLRAAAR